MPYTGIRYFFTILVMSDPEREVLSFFLPEGTLEWFNVVSGTKTPGSMQVVLEEKNIPPVTEAVTGGTVASKGFKDITVDDFPVRGRKTSLLFRRRYWKVEGQEKLLKRDIRLVWEGTQLEKEFALFLKE